MKLVTVEVTESSPSIFDAMQGGGMEGMGMICKMPYLI